MNHLANVISSSYGGTASSIAALRRGPLAKATEYRHTLKRCPSLCQTSPTFASCLALAGGHLQWCYHFGLYLPTDWPCHHHMLHRTTLLDHLEHAEALSSAPGSRLCARCFRGDSGVSPADRDCWKMFLGPIGADRYSPGVKISTCLWQPEVLGTAEESCHLCQSLC